MKLLLTSCGFTNKSISTALLNSLNKPINKSKAVFIPTASNIINNNKDWLIDDLINIKKQGFSYIDIVDISAVPKNNWKPRIENVDVLIFGGGNPYYLKYWFVKSGLNKILVSLLKNKIYVGISAGSMVLGNKFPIIPKPESLKYIKKNENNGLNIVNFSIMPHYKSSDSLEILEHKSNNISTTIYALDDNSAIKIDDDNLNIISEGQWKKFDKW